MHPLWPSLAVVLAGVGALAASTDGFAALTTESARRLAATRDAPLMPRALVETMTGAQEALPGPGRATVVEFIYTTCPDICQVAGGEMAKLRDRIEAGPLAGRVRLASLSFDPGRDDPEALARYGAGHGAAGRIWTVARPKAADLSDLLDAYGVTVIPDRFGGYTHNTALHVLSPEGRLVAILDIDDLDGAVAALAKVLK